VARYLDVPSAAYRNALGAFPAIADCGPQIAGTTQPVPGGAVTTGPCPAGGSGTNAFQYNQPAAQPGLGVPLGGIGAGSFMINQAGSFGPWDFGGADQNLNGSRTQFENRIEPQAAFHVREQVAGGSAKVRTLAVNAAPWNQLPKAWNPLKVGEGTYSALWPFGWTSYTPFSSGVSMRFWSPIVAGDDEHSSQPVAYFDLRLANTTSKTDHLSAMFTLPNAPEHDAKTVRAGLSSKVQTDARTGVTAVTLSSSSPTNTPDAKDSDWTIAAKPARGQKVSYLTSWNAKGDGGDVYRAFSGTGTLPNGKLDSSASAGAIAVSVTLKPGEVTTIPFAMAWDFPQTSVPNAGTCQANIPNSSCETWTNDPNQYFMRRYTSFYGAKETRTNDYVAGSYPGHQGFRIADRALDDHDHALALVRGWYDRIVGNPAYPDWLVREALNEEIHMIFNQAFWESGAIRTTPSTTTRIGAAVPGTHLFCTSTGGNWGSCNEWDTDAWGYLAELLLWPSVEKGRLLGVVQEAYQDVNGVGDTGAARNTATDSVEPYVGRLQFTQVPMVTIMRCYAYYRRTGDKAFLRYAYPAMLKLLKTVQAGIVAPDHFPADKPGQEDSYDAWRAEIHNVYNAGLWLLTEEIIIDLGPQARAAGIREATPDLEEHFKADLPQAKQQYELMFWNPVLHHYTMDPGGADYQGGYFVDRFFAQQIATTLGLPPLVPIEHEVEDLKNAYPHEMQVKVDGHYTGPPNNVPAEGPPVLGYGAIEEQEIWPGAAMEFAGTYLQAAQATHDPSLKAQGLEIAHALEYWMTEKVSLGFLFEEPGGWENDDPSVYRSPSFNQERTTLGVLHTLSPLVPWAVPVGGPKGTVTKTPATGGTAPGQVTGGLPSTGPARPWLPATGLGLLLTSAVALHRRRARGAAA
jgi:uncharacterized protein (DUF608 family)